MNFFIKHIKVNRDGILTMLVFQTGLFILGVIMVACINAFLNDTQDYANIGGLMAVFATVFGGMIRGGGGLNRYRLAVSMGRTRRSYMFFDPLLTIMNSVIGVCFAWLLSRLELWFYSMIYPGWTLEIDFFTKLTPRWLALLILAMCLLDFFFGALMLRFGTKGFAAVWFPLCILPAVTGGCISALKEGSTNLMAQIGKGILFLIQVLSPTMWVAVGITLLLALLALSVLCYRKAEVRM